MNGKILVKRNADGEIIDAYMFEKKEAGCVATQINSMILDFAGEIKELERDCVVRENNLEKEIADWEYDGWVEYNCI